MTAPRLFRSTRGRLALISTAALAVALTFADVGLLAGLSYVAGQTSDSELAGQARTVAVGLSLVSDRLAYQGGPLPAATPSGTAIDIAVVGPSGTLGETATEPFTSKTLRDVSGPAVRLGRTLWLELDDKSGNPTRIFVLPVTLAGDRAAVVASRSLTEQDASLRSSLAVLAALSVLILVLGFLLAYWLTGRVLQPVSQIAGLAETLSEHDLHRRVQVRPTHDELGDLVATFNRMLDRLEESFEGLRSFTADASHELRGPLARIRTEVELGLSRQRSTSEYARILAAVEEEAEHLSRLVERLLILARADAGALVPDLKEFDLVDFIHESVERWSGAAAAARVTLAATVPDTGRILADPLLLRRIVDNLLDNAIRHSPPSGIVLISAERADESWRLEVADEGQGIPATDRKRVFERFTQLDQARSHDPGQGAGLGLALCAAIARSHGGELRIAESTQGARLVLTLPDPRSKLAATPSSERSRR